MSFTSLQVQESLESFKLKQRTLCSYTLNFNIISYTLLMTIIEISCNTVVTLIEGIFFLALSLATIPFTWQAFVQYESKVTSFQRAEVPIDGSEIPTFSFCFGEPFNYNRSQIDLPLFDYVLGKTFNISYYVDLAFFNITSEGDKFIEASGEQLNVQWVRTYHVCYKVSSTAKEWRGYARGIRINFEPWFPKEKLPPSVEFFLTSEHNAYTITFGKRMNGKSFKYRIDLGTQAMFGITAEKYIYLKETSQCTDKSFWEIWEPYYANYPGFEKCPKRCAAITLPNNRYVKLIVIVFKIMYLFSFLKHTTLQKSRRLGMFIFTNLTKLQ